MKARRAALEAERAELIKKQALEQERLQLDQRRRELELDKELAKVEAEERVYNEALGSENSVAKASPPAMKKTSKVNERKSHLNVHYAVVTTF